MNRQNSPRRPAGALRTYRTGLSSCAANERRLSASIRVDERLVRSNAHLTSGPTECAPLPIERQGTSRLTAAEQDLAHMDSSKLTNNVLTY
jgi:hypothetical protein